MYPRHSSLQITRNNKSNIVASTHYPLLYLLFLTLSLNKLSSLWVTISLIVINIFTLFSYFKMWPFIWTNLNFLYLSRGDRFKAGKEQGWRKKRLGVKQREQAKTDRDGEQLKWSDTPQGVKRTKSKSSILSKHTLFQFWLKLAKWFW